MESWADADFLIPTWQTGLENIKHFAKERGGELRSNNNEEEDAAAKIVICEA